MSPLRLRPACAAAITAALLSLPAAAQAATPVLALGFDEGTGTTTADASGQGNHGTLDGATWTSAGKHGNALDFDGVDDLVSVADAPSLALTTSGTLSAWVKPDDKRLDDPVFSKGDGYGLFAADYNTLAPSGFIGREWLISESDLVTGDWTHVAVTFDQGAPSAIYVDGVAVPSWSAQASADPISADGPLTVGAATAFGNWFDGRIDDVRVYDVALTATEVAADRDAGV
jgi:hypothetical protein